MAVASRPTASNYLQRTPSPGGLAADRDRARAAVHALRTLHAPEYPDPFEVLREDLHKHLGRPKPGRRAARDLMHLADAVTALVAEAEASRLLGE
jgi:hypothetical protein